MAPPLLVFDLDGTLVDSATDLLATLDVVLTTHGFRKVDPASARNGIGYGARHLIEFGLQTQGKSVPAPQLDRMHRDFLDYYESHIADFTRPYHGAVELLDRFAAADWAFAICTNKVEALSRQVLAAIGFADRFAAVCGGDTFPTRKPHPGHVLRTIAAAGGSPATSIMVGDSSADVDAARAAGIPVIGVTFGYSPVPMASLAPDVLIHDFHDLSVTCAAALFARPGPAPARRPDLAFAAALTGSPA